MRVIDLSKLDLDNLDLNKLEELKALEGGNTNEIV